MTQEITVVPVDARTADWPRKVAMVLNRLQNTTALAGGTASWGSITGTLSAQTDLSTALSGKQAALVSGTNIKTINSTSLLGAGDLVIGGVTSVAATVPTGFTVTGSPITSTGTLAISFTAGYSLPPDASQANWNTAFGWGDHAGEGYLTTAAAAAAYQPLDTQLTSLAGLSYASNALKVVRVNAGETAFELATVAGGSLADGDYGDITVGSSGTTLTIDNDAVTYAKMQNVSAASKLLGRGAASGSGDVEEITLGTGLSMSGTTLSASSSSPTILHAQHQRASGTSGGTATAATHNTVPMTQVTNTIAGASVASNQITLPAGTYRVRGYTMAHKTGGSRIRLRNVTDGTTLLLGASNFVDTSATSGSGTFPIFGQFTLAGTKAIELQLYAGATQATNGLGVAASSGETEVFADVMIENVT